MNSGEQWKPLVFKDFLDLKQKAYKTALAWNSTGNKAEWLDRHIKQFAPSSGVWEYEDVIHLYSRFLNNEISQSVAEQKIKKIEADFNETEKTLEEMVGFQLAMGDAFKKAGKEYGEVTFQCPICTGRAYGARHHTPDNIAHKVSIRGGCDDCGHSMMN